MEGATVPDPIEKFHYVVHEDFCDQLDIPYALMIYDPSCANRGYHIHDRPCYSRGRYRGCILSLKQQKRKRIQDRL